MQALPKYLILLPVMLLSLPTYAVELGEFESEAQRLQTVQALIQQEKSRRLQPSTKVNPVGEDTQCESMLKDLLGGNEFKAIEPVAVLNFEYPIQNADRSIYERDESLLPPFEKQQSEYAAKQLGPFLTEGIQRCTDEEANGNERKAIALFNGFGYLAGAPPFRVYMLSKKVNPFPKSKLVYWSEFVEATRKGRKGYSWVNLDICEHTDGIPSLTDSMRLKNDPKGQRSALTLYRGKVVAWDAARGFMFTANVVSSKSKRTNRLENICSWSTYPEEPIRR